MDSSRFALLPRELRDLIWTYSLNHGGLIHRNGAWKLRSNSCVPSALTLRLVCRQICDESSRLFIAANSTLEFRHRLFKQDGSGTKTYQRGWVDTIERIPSALIGTRHTHLQLRLDFVDLCLPVRTSRRAYLNWFIIGEDVFRVCQHLHAVHPSLEITLYYHTPGEATSNGFKRPVRYETLRYTFSTHDYARAHGQLLAAYEAKRSALGLLDGDPARGEASCGHLTSAAALMEDIVHGCFFASEGMQDLLQGIGELDLTA